MSIICCQYVSECEYELAFGRASTFSSLCPHTVEVLVFDCVNVSLDVWTLRNCFQSDPFLTGINQSILTQKEERFRQIPIVKADVATCGKIRKGFTHPFLAHNFYGSVKILIFISVVHLCILF